MRARILSFHCVLTNRMGQVISKTFNRDVITRAEGREDMIKGLAGNLEDLTQGEKRRVVLRADQAYGFYDPRLVLEVPRRQLTQGPTLKVGDEVVHSSWEGGPKTFRVTGITGPMVVLDGNHPLAGQDLIFDIEATEARDATPEEISDSGVERPGPLLH